MSVAPCTLAEGSFLPSWGYEEAFRALAAREAVEKGCRLTYSNKGRQCTAVCAAGCDFRVVLDVFKSKGRATTARIAEAAFPVSHCSKGSLEQRSKAVQAAEVSRADEVAAFEKKAAAEVQDIKRIEGLRLAVQGGELEEEQRDVNRLLKAVGGEPTARCFEKEMRAEGNLVESYPEEISTFDLDPPSTPTSRASSRSPSPLTTLTTSRSSSFSFPAFSSVSPPPAWGARKAEPRRESVTPSQAPSSQRTQRRAASTSLEKTREMYEDPFPEKKDQKTTAYSSASRSPTSFSNRISSTRSSAVKAKTKKRVVQAGRADEEETSSAGSADYFSPGSDEEMTEYDELPAPKYTTAGGTKRQSAPTAEKKSPTSPSPSSLSKSHKPVSKRAKLDKNHDARLDPVFEQDEDEEDWVGADSSVDESDGGIDADVKPAYDFEEDLDVENWSLPFAPSPSPPAASVKIKPALASLLDDLAFHTAYDFTPYVLPFSNVFGTRAQVLETVLREENVAEAFVGVLGKREVKMPRFLAFLRAVKAEVTKTCTAGGEAEGRSGG
ncbi:hypothetical protein JCM10213_002435 [Rhodosporidiobolus nylandii]